MAGLLGAVLPIFGIIGILVSIHWVSKWFRDRKGRG